MSPADTGIDTSAAAPLLLVEGLSVRYGSDPEIAAVDQVDLRLEAGQTLGILGESGCGKSSLALALAGLLPAASTVTGRIELAGQRLTDLAEKDWRRLRGREIGTILQQPSLALHPMLRVGGQIIDVLRGQRGKTRQQHRAAALQLMAEVGLASECFDAYPHQLSGGQQQRIVICQALARGPRLLLADEPTTALDSATEEQVLELVAELQRQRSLSIVWISHDPGVLARLAQLLVVMYAGRWIEQGPTIDVLNHPMHPYTQALLACRPDGRGGRLGVIPGAAPRWLAKQRGCRFAERCDRRVDCCEVDDPLPVARPGGQVWCRRHGEQAPPLESC